MDKGNIMTDVLLYASTHSTDNSTQNAAFLVNDEGEILSKSANFFPKGVTFSSDRLNRPQKYMFYEHAERNVIYDCAKNGIKTDGLTMFVVSFACADCARAIIQAGIKKVIGWKKAYDVLPERWKESVNVGLMMFQEAGVEYEYYDGEINEKFTILLDNKIIKNKI